MAARLDLSGAAERLEELRRQRGEEETARCRDLLAKVVQRCATWDSGAAGQLGCLSGLWLLDGEVWDRAQTVDVVVEGAVPSSALRRCREPVIALCHALAGSVRLAIPRNNAGGLRLTILPREGQSLAELGTALQGRGLQIRSALSDSADRRPM